MFFSTQRFEKLCRSILGSMEVENEPKVSMIIVKESSVRTDFELTQGVIDSDFIYNNVLFFVIRFGMCHWLFLKTSPSLGSSRLKISCGSPVSS